MRIPLSISRFSSEHGWLGGALLLYVGMASAGENGAFSESAYLDEIPVVLSVSRLSQPVDEAPAAVTVIDRQMIREAGAKEVHFRVSSPPIISPCFFGIDKENGINQTVF